ncbi:putative nicotinate-nucleotide pyrophosphorylase [carboxylating] [Candidatus Entotheonellaceae bacterium PAL068K]
MKPGSSPLLSLYPLQYDSLVHQALQEDLGRAGDITTNAIIFPEAHARGCLIARRPGCIAGLDVAACTFRTLDPDLDVRPHDHDGAMVQAGAVLAEVRGSARALLAAERVALNFLGRLSGIATATRGLVEAVQDFPTRVVCTRKTTPGWRTLEKYAVRVGGGANHRFGLDDAVLIKDNHLVVAGSVAEAVRRVRSAVGHLVKIEVEMDTLSQLEEALSCEIDAVLLDNMAPPQLKEAVELVDGRVITEASGGISLETARDVAAAGVDLLSAGWLTHSAPALDIGLDLSV